MFKKGKRLLLTLCLTTTLCACANTEQSSEGENSGGASSEIQDETQYDYQLKAGEPVEVYDVTFEQMVTVTVDPDSTRDGANDLRSDMVFDNCTFRGGLTILGDYHAMVSLGKGCVFGEDSVVTYRASSADVAGEATLEDNLVKLFVGCEGVVVETEAAMGVLTDGPDVILNGTAYRKDDLAPDADFLGIYHICQGGTMTYIKFAIGEDDSAVILD